MKTYLIQDRETGIAIEEAKTLIEAKKIVELYEEEDKLNKDFVEDFYEIIEIIK